ncbi:MAG: site-2 protease family protein [Mycobacteriales bacterium]
MLYALGNPVSLLLLLLSFVVATTVHGYVQAVVAGRSGHRPASAEDRATVDPRRHIDPFGAVSAAIAGVGWAKPVESPDRRQRGAMVATLLSGSVANIGLGLVALVAFRAVGGPSLAGGSTLVLQQGASGDLLLRGLLLFGLSNLFVGALSLVPLPPLDGGRLLLALAPQTAGWRKAEYQLVERNIGVAVLLALLLIPLGGPQALLPTLLDILVSPVVRLVTGG